MKRNSALCLSASLAVFLTLAAPCLADEIKAGSELRSATVYTSGAELTRRAVVEVPAGAHTVVLRDVPPGLLPDSLRAKGKAAAGVTIGALSYKAVPASELTDPREKELTDQLETLQDNLRMIDAEKQALAARRTFLERLGDQAVLRENEDIAAIDLKPDQWAGAAQAIQSELAGALKGDIELDARTRNLNREIEKLNAELAQIRTGRRSTWQVSIPVEASAATKLTVDLSYQVNEATWQPIYDARLDTATGALELVEYGAVRQRTGEDWKDIDLTLSTAQPHRGAGLPDLSPLWVNLWQGGMDGAAMDMAGAPGMVQNFASARMAKSEALMDMAAPVAQEMAAPAVPPMPEEKEAVFTGAVIETGGFVSEYKIPGPSAVPADGTENKLMVGPFETDSVIQVQIKPQLGNEAYLVAKAKLKGENPILPGQVSLFRDGAFVGQAYLPLLRPGEEKELPFGIDDQVSVKRNVLKDERSEAGIIARDQTLERHFIREIRNLHAQPVEIAVLETVPAPQDQKIRLDIPGDVTTPGYEKDVNNIKGLLRWSFKLEPKAEKDIRLGWKLSWPADHQLSGL